MAKQQVIPMYYSTENNTFHSTIEEAISGENPLTLVNVNISEKDLENIKFWKTQFVNSKDQYNAELEAAIRKVRSKYSPIFAHIIKELDAYNVKLPDTEWAK